MKNYRPTQVIPPPLREVVEDMPTWFVIGGQAVRCFCPYRPSRDVDFGVAQPNDLDQLLSHLTARGTVEIHERSQDTVHLRFNGVNVSIFVLEHLVPFTEDRHLTITGILATKLHAILDRGLRRDFFDLYITLQQQRLGIAECLASLRQVYQQPVADGLLLRALTYFEDAEREAPLPGEGPKDWKLIKEFFQTRVGCLLVPPGATLEIQSRVVDVGS